MPVYDPLQFPSYASDPECREYLLLRLLAKIFEFELEIERRLQCAGSGKLPDEWRAYRERELQKTWDKVHRYELDRARAVQDEESISLSHGFSAGVGYPPPPDVHHDPRTRITSVPYTMDDGVYISQPAGRSTPARRHADSSASPDFTAFGGEERAQPQNQQLAISATSSMAFNTLSRLSDGGKPETNSSVSPSVERALNPLHDRQLPIPAPTSTAHLPSVSGIFNSAQNTTVDGGTFNSVQGNLNIMIHLHMHVPSA